MRVTLGKNLLQLRKERRVQRVAQPISGAQWPTGPIQTPGVGKPDAATSTHPATTQSDWGGRQRGIPIQMATERREPRPGLLQFSGMQIPTTSHRLPLKGHTLRQPRPDLVMDDTLQTLADGKRRLVLTFNGKLLSSPLVIT